MHSCYVVPPQRLQNQVDSLLMSEYFQSFASKPRLPSINLGFNTVSRKSMTVPSSSTSFSINQSYNSLVGSMKNLVSGKKNDNHEMISASQTVLPKIGESTDDLARNNWKQGIRKSKSENAVNSDTKTGSLNAETPFQVKAEQNSSLSTPLEKITDHDFFGSTVPSRSLLEKIPKTAKENEMRMEQLRKDIAITGDSLNSSGNKSELSITTNKDGKRRVSRRKKDKKRESIKGENVYDNDSNTTGTTKKSRRKSSSRSKKKSPRKPRNVPLLSCTRSIRWSRLSLTQL